MIMNENSGVSSVVPHHLCVLRLFVVRDAYYRYRSTVLLLPYRKLLKNNTYAGKAREVRDTSRGMHNAYERARAQVLRTGTTV